MTGRGICQIRPRSPPGGSGPAPANSPGTRPPRLGYDSLGSYLRERRAAGWTWRAMAAESGQPESWLRRQAARGY